MFSTAKSSSQKTKASTSRNCSFGFIRLPRGLNCFRSRVPASIVFFDLLCEGDRDWRIEPFERRREKLESLLAGATPPIHLTPATRESSVASDWFRRFEGAGLDGVMAKPISGTYQPDKRVMFKVKHERDCDCVVAGFRWHKGGEGTAVGSLLLGLYDDSGALQHVGVCASFTQAKRQELVKFLAPYRRDALADHPWKSWAEAAQMTRRIGCREARAAGARARILSWEPLRPELVVEVAYEHMQGTRFRHMAQFRRWRTDKQPRDCTYAQLEVVPPHELKAIFCRKRVACTAQVPFFDACSLRHSRVGSSSGSGVSFSRPQLFGHMAQVDSDPRPAGRSAAHRIDQHVIGGEELRSLGMFSLPSFQSR